jgi:hypothetical protein
MAFLRESLAVLGITFCRDLVCLKAIQRSTVLSSPVTLLSRFHLF